MKGEGASATQKAMLAVYQGTYLDHSLRDAKTNQEQLTRVEEDYIQALVDKVGAQSPPYTLQQSEADLCLRLIGESNMSMVDSPLSEWHDYFEHCCTIAHKLTALKGRPDTTLTHSDLMRLRSLYNASLSSVTAAQLGALERRLLVLAMEAELIPDSPLFRASQACRSIVEKLAVAPDGMPHLTPSEQTIIAQIPQLMLITVGRMVRRRYGTLLFGDPHYSGQSPSIEQDMVTRRMLDLRVARLARYANEDQRQKLRTGHWGFRCIKPGKMYGMSVASLGALQTFSRQTNCGVRLETVHSEDGDHTIPYRLMAISMVGRITRPNNAVIF